jgi:hypothetical protein
MAIVQLPWVATAMLAVGSALLGNPGVINLTRPTQGHPGIEIIAARDAAHSEGGITGQVEIRPVRPHATLGTPNNQPYQARIEVLDASGRAVTTFESDASGGFRVALPPGKYTLRPQSPGRYPRASQQTVVVAPQRFTEVHITYDSGIR